MNSDSAFAAALESFHARVSADLRDARRRLADRFYAEFCNQRIMAVGGWVLLFNEKPFAWTLDLRHAEGPRRYVPGVIAVPVHPEGEWFIACGGSPGPGAERWESLK